MYVLRIKLYYSKATFLIQFEDLQGVGTLLH